MALPKNPMSNNIKNNQKPYKNIPTSKNLPIEEDIEDTFSLPDISDISLPEIDIEQEETLILPEVEEENNSTDLDDDVFSWDILDDEDSDDEINNIVPDEIENNIYQEPIEDNLEDLSFEELLNMVDDNIQEDNDEDSDTINNNLDNDESLEDLDVNELLGMLDDYNEDEDNNEEDDDDDLDSLLQDTDDDNDDNFGFDTIDNDEDYDTEDEKDLNDEINNFLNLDDSEDDNTEEQEDNDVNEPEEDNVEDLKALFEPVSKKEKKKKDNEDKNSKFSLKDNPLVNGYMFIAGILYNILTKLITFLGKIPVIGKIFRPLNKFIKVGGKKYFPLVFIILLFFIPFYFSVPKGVNLELPDEGAMQTHSFDYSDGVASGTIENTGDIIITGEPIYKIYGYKPSINPKTWVTYSYLGSCNGESIDIDISEEKEVSTKCDPENNGLFKKASIDFEVYF